MEKLDEVCSRNMHPSITLLYALTSDRMPIYKE